MLRRGNDALQHRLQPVELLLGKRDLFLTCLRSLFGSEVVLNGSLILLLVRVNNLSAEVLAEILLQARESPLDYFRNYFSHHGIRLTITEDGAIEIANTAYNQQVGVRGLKSILWHIMEDEMHHINQGARIIRLDKKYVQKQLNKRNMSNI